MNQIEMDFLCLALVLMGMVTLLSMNKWGIVPKGRLTFLAYEMLFYVLVLVAWGYLPALPNGFLWGVGIGYTLFIVCMITDEKMNVARVANLTANAGVLVLLMIRNW